MLIFHYNVSLYGYIVFLLHDLKSFTTVQFFCPLYMLHDWYYNSQGTMVVSILFLRKGYLKH